MNEIHKGSIESIVLEALGSNVWEVADLAKSHKLRKSALLKCLKRLRIWDSSIWTRCLTKHMSQGLARDISLWESCLNR